MQSKLKFIVDVGVSNKVEKWLIAQGFDAKSVRDIDPRMTDCEIIDIASKENRMVVTMDKDFGELVYKSNLANAGILLLRLESYSAEDKLIVVKNILATHQDKIVGRFCVYKDQKLRIR